MGFFSWNTVDTNESISNIYSNRGSLPVAMVNPKTGEIFEELNYDGYGVFGGKDYYELLAELNGYESNRNIGIDLELDGTKDYVAPLLLSYTNRNNWLQYVGQKPTICAYQGYFYEDECCWADEEKW